MSNEAAGSSRLFDPDRLTATGLPRDCQACKGSGRILGTYYAATGEYDATERVCGNCRGTGRAVVPY